MNYSFRYINKQKEPTYIGYTLMVEIIWDDSTVENYRIEKSFKVDDNLIDSEFLRAEALKEINRIIQEPEVLTEEVTEEVVVEEV